MTQTQDKNKEIINPTTAMADVPRYNNFEIFFVDCGFPDG